MATAATMDISLGDFKKSFQSPAELTQYLRERIVPKLHEAAADIWNSSNSKPRALNQDFAGELAGLWVDKEAYNGRSVEVGISVGVRF